jgi:hypothetical protein
MHTKSEFQKQVQIARVFSLKELKTYILTLKGSHTKELGKMRKEKRDELDILVREEANYNDSTEMS